MTTSRPSPHLFSVPMALAVAAACVSTLAAAQQPAAPQTAAPQTGAATRSCGARAPGRDQQAARYAGHRTLPGDERGSRRRYRATSSTVPRTSTALGRTKLGVVAWGNGGCSDDAASSRFHLLEIASHGYLVVASGRILSGPGAPPREPRPAAPHRSAPAAAHAGVGPDRRR